MISELLTVMLPVFGCIIAEYLLAHRKIINVGGADALTPERPDDLQSLRYKQQLQK